MDSACLEVINLISTKRSNSILMHSVTPWAYMAKFLMMGYGTACMCIISPMFAITSYKCEATLYKASYSLTLPGNSSLAAIFCSTGHTSYTLNLPKCYFYHEPRFHGFEGMLPKAVYVVGNLSMCVSSNLRILLYSVAIP